MDKPNLPENPTTWGTWEELLLSCAVHRHGTQNWDSVAAELRPRTSNLGILTAQTCKRKFQDLRRRFNHLDGGDASPIPWLDQLRQLRLDELRREVQSYDVSIVSLQLKVEKLKQVREQSLRSVDEQVEKSDPEKIGEDEIEAEPEKASPEVIADKDGSGEAPDRSCNKSNTSDPNSQAQAPNTGVDAAENEREPVEPVAGEIGTAEKTSNQVVEDSWNGSSDSVAKGVAVAESEKMNSGELRESAAESKRENKEGQSSSEVQCSAKTLAEETKPGEPVQPVDQEDQSPAMKQVPVESQPLVDFFKILRSNNCASFFERRLASQDTPLYSSMIRQHLDFELVQTRLEGGYYSSCKSKLFRDLLLICQNAVVFFGKKSPEYKAACELQLRVSKEMALQLLVSKEMPLEAPKQDQTPPKEANPAPTVVSVKPETESSESSLLAKSKLSLPLTACRKRSSIKARPSTSSLAPDKKNDLPTPSLPDAKPAATNWKQKEESSDEDAEKLPVTTKRRRERVNSNTRNISNKNTRSRSDTNKDKSSDANANVGSSSRTVTTNENSESIAETDKKSNSNPSGKKQSAEKFLSRIKRSSTSNNKSETIPENNSKGGPEQKKTGNGKGSASQKSTQQRKNGNGKAGVQKGAEPNKGGNGKGSAVREPTPRRASGGKQVAKEQGSPMKKSSGRAAKRAAETTRAPPAKRRR